MHHAVLPTFSFPVDTRIPQTQSAEQPKVTLDSPALAVMTDLTAVRAATVEPDVRLPIAEQLMIHQGVRLLFVVRDFPRIVGLVTTTDLLGEKPMRVVQDRNIHHDDILVSDVMTPLSRLDAIDYDLLCRSTVGSVVLTFRQFGRRHLVAVQAATEGTPAMVRGVLSLTQLERQLGHSINAVEIAGSFADVEQALAHS